MKKWICWITVLLVTVSFSSMAPNRVEAADEKMDVTIIGGSIAGAWYAMAQGMAESIKKQYPGSRADVVPGGDAGNVKRTASNEAAFAFCYLPTAISGYEGSGPFPKAMKNLRVLASVFPAYEQFYILRSSEITSFEQIKREKHPLKLGANIKHSASEALIKSALAFYGMSYQDIESWGGKIMFLQTNPTNDLIKGGQLEAHVGTFPVPFPKMSQMNSTHPIRLLPMSDAAISFLVERHGGEKGVIPAGTYPFQDGDIQTAKTFCLLLTSSDMPEKEVYKIVKAIDQHRDYLGDVHKALANYSTEFMATQHKIPFHRGAAKYYREAGVLK